ncbi:MAG: hypothetical protein JWN38_578 [Candidatus Saccharibacteria bacterium]|nr:hypothetical protein [Candidatus Saccharibacteria bacterium]
MPKKSAPAKKSTKRPAAQPAVAQKPPAKLTLPEAPPKPTGRRLKPAEYKSFRLSKRIRHPIRLPNAVRLSRQALRPLLTNKRLFGSIIVVYGLFSLVLVQGFGGTDVSGLKDQLNQILTGNLGQVGSSIIVFSSLVSTAGGNAGGTASVYQMMLSILVSLAIIWTLRQVAAGAKVRMRDAYYLGMYPLIPFAMVLITIGLQLLPLILGATVYNLVISNGIATYGAERLVWALLYGLLALLSLYMVSSSLFALYIVTLPEMTPLKALRSARALVRYRRWTVLRKVLFLPLLLLVLAAIIMLPIILLVTALAQWVFFLLTMAAVVVIHSYLYTLYRELLREQD